MIATRFKNKLGSSGDWNPDTATSHIYRAGTGRTLCGVRVGTSLERGGPWEISNWPESSASCRHCLGAKAKGRK